jgi:hypothetical protein
MRRPPSSRNRWVCNAIVTMMVHTGGLAVGDSINIMAGDNDDDDTLMACESGKDNIQCNTNDATVLQSL